MRTRDEIEKANIKRIHYFGAFGGTEVYESTMTGEGDKLILEVLLDIRDLLTPPKQDE